MTANDAVIFNDIETKATVGMLTEGSFGIVHTLGISCQDEFDMEGQWGILRLCRHWRVSAGYRSDSAMLTLQGWGDPIPIMQPVNGARLCIVPKYAAQWEMNDPDAVRFFMAGCKRHGYFALVPAINMAIDESRRPLLAFLKQKGDIA